MITLKESILTNTKNKVGSVKSSLKCLGIVFDIYKIRLSPMLVCDRFMEMLNGPALKRVTAGMKFHTRVIEDEITRLEKLRYNEKHGWDSLVMLLLWIDNLDVSASNGVIDKDVLLDDCLESTAVVDDIFSKSNVPWKPNRDGLYFAHLDYDDNECKFVLCNKGSQLFEFSIKER